MAEPNTVAVRLALEGAEEILNQLKALGVEGGKAADQLKASLEGGGGGLLGSFGRAVDEISNKVQSALKGVGDFKVPGLGSISSDFKAVADSAGTVVTRVLAVEAAVIAAAGGFVFFVKSAASAAAETGRFAQTLGLSTQAYEQLSFAAASSGVDQEKFAKSMRTLVKGVTELAKAQSEAARAFEQGLGVKSVSTLEGFNAITGGSKETRAELTALGLRVVGIGENFEDVRQKLVGMGVRFADTSLNIAGSKVQLDGAAGAIQNLGVRVIEGKDKIRPLEDIIGDLAEKFQLMGEGPKAAATAIAIFGKSGNALLPLLLKGRDGIAELKLAFDGLDISIAGQTVSGQLLESSFTRLFAVVNGVKNKIGLAFAPQVTVGVNAITDALARGVGMVTKFADALAAQAAPAVAAFLKIITGVDVSKELKLSPDQIVKAAEWETTFREIGATIEQFATRAKTFFVTVLPAIFTTVLSTLDKLASGFEKITGIKLSGEELGLVLLGTQLLGINTLVLNLIQTFGLLLIAAATVLGAGGLIVLAGAAFAAFAAWDFAPIVTRSLKAWEDIKAQWEKSPFTSLSTLFKTQLDNAADLASKIAPATGPSGRLAAEGLKALSKAFQDEAPKTKSIWDDSIGGITGTGVASAKTVGDAYVKGFDLAAQASANVKKEIDAAAAAAQKIAPAFKVVSVGGAQDDKSSIKFKTPDDFKNLGKPAEKTDATAATALADGFTQADQKIRGIVTALRAFVEEQAAAMRAAMSSALTIDGGAAQGAGAPGAAPPGGDAAAGAGGGVAEKLIAPFTAARDRIAAMLSEIGASINEFSASFSEGLATIFDGLASKLDEAASRAESAAQRIVQAAQQALDAVNQVSSAESSGGQIGSPFAGGGHVWGGGTETSDSIMARLSRNEFVVNAHQTGGLGLSFMHFINKKGVKLDDVFNRFFRIPRLALGGPVGTPIASALRIPKFSFDGVLDDLAGALFMPGMQRFAGGGLVPANSGTSGRTLAISLDGVTVHAVTSQRDANALERAATRSKRRSAGQRQSAIG